MPTTAPAALRWMVERCLARDPEQRYDSTRDLFRNCARSGTTSRKRTPLPAPLSSGPRARRSVSLSRASCYPCSPEESRWGDGWLGRNRDVLEWTGIQLGGPGIAMRPVVSPDGELLAFSAMGGRTDPVSGDEAGLEKLDRADA